ncbi:hypothetical protein IPN35_00905 [Candidatus Peregrinibacteria bacterium]|jgi:hypothetical protein|nr:MAG: hypothetical protein IPN35_00905 [Candidatus Peregrinibacteria bacterium]
MNHSIENHRVFNPEDYEKLKTKGYGNAEIEEIWDKDLRQRTVSDLLWQAAKHPQTAEDIVAEFYRLKDDNPFTPNSINHA